MENNQKNKINLKAVDFFCGAGGMTSGFKKAGINVLAGIDIDASCKATYESNNKGSIFIQADISVLKEKELTERLGVEKNDDELIFVGCSPCQYYSNIQTDREKSSETKMLLIDFQRFANYFRPGYIVIENVPGFDSNDESPLQKFKKYLSRSGYVFDNSVVNALHYNVPQTRKRYLLIATRVKKEIKLPKPIRITNHLVLRNYIGEWNGFKSVPAGHKDNSAFLHTTANLREINLIRIKATPKNGGTRLAWKNNQKLQLKCYVNKDNTFPDVYGRMSWDEPAPTLTTKFCSISNGRFGHPEDDRAISLREGAVLQTFPKNYKFIETSVGAVARMIGNAVPPELARRVGISILKNHK